MHKIRYSIGILIDSVGRLIMCSEHVTTTNTRLMYSLSVEKYLSINEDPETAIIKKLTSQLGINSGDFEKINKVAEMEYINTGKGTLIKNVYIYAYQIKKLLTLNIYKPDNNPIRPVAFNKLQKLVNGESIYLSACAKRAMKFLKVKQHTIFKNAFT